VITRLRPPLDSDDLDRQIVAALAVSDLALEALVAAFFVQHPRLDHASFVRPDAWDVELRHAQLAISLSRALQRCLAHYVAVLAERIARETDDDIPF
jgi:hypothetical protein